MAKEYRTIRNDVALPYQWALGRTWTRFFDGLKEEKILGTKCSRCKKVWTLVKARYYGQVKEPPYIIATIQLDGTDCGFHHFIGGIDLSDIKKVNQELKAGARVKAVWRPEKKADILDIACFEPAG
ncbi:MAG: hypothetical protein H6Q41_5284 [Deltaproteobacteria bacterium]|nr:hypothetical protein [Deltaproteobacteria bacterium]